MKELKLNEVSPYILHEISVNYGISYLDLMLRAGHVKKKNVCKKCGGTRQISSLEGK